MSRSDNIKKNLTFNMIKFVTQLVLQFILRTVFIKLLSEEYLGLNGLFSNIFNFLNLAELGIGTAIVYSMYKPIADNDVEKIKALQNYYKKFYLIISCIVAGVGLIITPFIPYLMNGGTTVEINIYILYLMYLVNTLLGYYSAHKRSLLFAYQRNDVENKIKTICIATMTILQILTLIVFKNYYVYFIITIIFTFMEGLIVNIVAKKMYPEIEGKSEPLDSITKKEITKNVSALSMHKIGGLVVFSTDNILISSLFGVAVLGVYSNYNLIITSLGSVFGVLINALTASIGNLICSQSTEYNYNRYKQINIIFFYLCSFCTVCLVCLFQPFMLFWTKKESLMLEWSTVILIILSFYFTRMREGVGAYKSAAGLYWQDRWKPVAEALINFVVSIVLGLLIGINGIFIGTIVSTLLAPFWVEPKVLYKYYFDKSPKNYFIKYIFNTLIMIGVSIVCYLICGLIPVGGIWLLLLKFAVCIVLSNLLLFPLYLPFKEFRDVLLIVKRLFLKIFKKNQG